jgi:hypothetical protein
MVIFHSYVNVYQRVASEYSELHIRCPACHSLAGSPSCSVDALSAASARPKGNPRSLGQKIGGVGFMVDLWMIYGEFMMDLWWIYEGFTEDLWTTGDLLWILFRLKSSESSKIIARLKCHFFLLVKSCWLISPSMDPGFLDYPAGFFTRCLTTSPRAHSSQKLAKSQLLISSGVYKYISIYVYNVWLKNITLHLAF